MTPKFWSKRIELWRRAEAGEGVLEFKNCLGMWRSTKECASGVEEVVLSRHTPLRLKLLKSCPYCGTEDSDTLEYDQDDVHRYARQCANLSCGCRTDSWRTQALADKSWNRRPDKQ